MEEPYDLLAAVLVIFILGYLWERYDDTLKNTFHYVGHVVMPFAILAVLTEHNDEPYAFILIVGIYVYSLLKSHREWARKVFLYAAFTTGVITLYSISDGLRKVIKFPLRYTYLEYILPIGAVLIGCIWLLMNTRWKERTAYYIIPFNLLALGLLLLVYPFGYPESILMLACISLEIFLMHHYRLQILQILPLWVFFIGLNQFIYFRFKRSSPAVIVALVVAVFVIKIIGELLSNKLYGKNEDNKAIPVYFDWFVVMSLALTSEIGNKVGSYDYFSKWGDMIAPLIVVYIVYSQIKRVPKGLLSSIAKTLAGLSLLLPYYTLVGKLYEPVYVPNIYKLIETELIVFPWIILAMVLSRKVWKGYEYITSKVEMGVLVIVGFLLCKDLTGPNQLKEGLILGVLSLASIIGGMQFKKKSFFFVGSGVLIFNMFVQTRDFWGNLPWWVYLLVAGMILIGTASLNEIQKNKKLFKIDKKAILDKFKDWD